MRFVRGFVFLLVVTIPATSRAQNQFWAEVGSQRVELGDGQVLQDAGFGFGITLAAGARAHRGVGVLFEVGDELRVERALRFNDNLSFAEVGLRLGPLSFGPGANFVVLDRNDVPDARCRLSGVALQQFLLVHATSPSTCINNVEGTRGLGVVHGPAGSAFARLRFGPNGNGFLQTRLMVFPVDTFKVHDHRRQGFKSPEFPGTDSAWDIRASAGYAFGSGRRGSPLIRLEYIQRDIRFLRQFDNSNGVFNQTERQIMLGAGFFF